MLSYLFVISSYLFELFTEFSIIFSYIILILQRVNSKFKIVTTCVFDKPWHKYSNVKPTAIIFLLACLVFVPKVCVRSNQETSWAFWQKKKTENSKINEKQILKLESSVFKGIAN